jgi:phosphoribosylaminoimidazole-succinocarboxamide synthase
MPEVAVARHARSGKVRELYALGDRLLLVATDRISAFDVVLPTPIPDKGRVLTGLSRFWFARTSTIVRNHLLDGGDGDVPAGIAGDGPTREELAGRAMLVRRLVMLPVEFVVRGYLAGSAWKDYHRDGAVCGHRLPRGLREADRLPEPLFTPATKAASGHDQNIDAEAAATLVGRDRLERGAALALALYTDAAGYAGERGIIVADTKVEFGVDEAGELVLADELFTPDSSRFWPADGYAPGRAQPSFDKQYVRDWLETLDWDKTPPGPELPADVVAGTRARYVEAYERLTGEPFARYLERTGAAPCA